MELITNKLKLLFAEQFYFALCECSNTTFHMTGAKRSPFVGEIPTPGRSVYESFYQTHDELLFGKRIQPEDVSYMIKNHQWVSGTKYAMYDDKDNDMQDKQFFVVSDQEDGSYGVFKCIYKNPLTDPVSVYKPLVNQTTPSDEIYITGDGYHWKYMFSIDPITYNKFATSTYVPVVIDSQTVSSAVPGTIDAILTENPGSEYNNYAFGNIKSVNYENNILKFAINSDDVLSVKTYDLVYSSNTTFSQGDVVTIQVPGEDSVEATVYKKESLSVSFAVTANTQNITQSTVASANAAIIVSSNTVSAEVVAIQEENLPTLSNDNNFYKNASFYIRGGAGAGQIKTIEQYEIIGNDRVITVDSAFETPINLTSVFSILPKIIITGDGHGAIALPEIDPSANSISDIRIVNRGSGYTYAAASISGNTGVISANGSPVLTDSAELRPIIAPPGGHGSDAIEELYGSNIGVSVKFVENEVLDNVSFSEFSMIRNLLHNDIQLTVDTLSEGDYEVGEIITQQNEKARGEVSSINEDANVITLTNVFGDFVVSANNTISGNTSTSVVTSVNRSTDVFNNDIALQVSPIISAFTVGETVKQNNSNATGVVISSTPTVINIVELFGSFTTDVSDVLIGQTSGAQALVTSVGTRKIVDNSGDVVYIENTSQLDRSDSTTEQIKLIVKF